MQRSCIDGCKLCETARRRCPNGVRKNLRAELEKTSFAAIALPTIGTIGVDADTVTDLPPRYALAHVQDATRKFMAHDHAGSIDTVCSRMEVAATYPAVVNLQENLIRLRRRVRKIGFAQRKTTRQRLWS